MGFIGNPGQSTGVGQQHRLWSYESRDCPSHFVDQMNPINCQASITPEINIEWCQQVWICAALYKLPTRRAKSLQRWYWFSWFLSINGLVYGKNYRKAPWSSWEHLWFPVKIFPRKPNPLNPKSYIILRPRQTFLGIFNILLWSCVIAEAVLMILTDFKTPIGIRVQQMQQMQFFGKWFASKELWFSRSCRGHQNYASTFCGHKTTAVQVALIVIFSGEGSGAHLSKSSPSQNFNLPVPFYFGFYVPIQWQICWWQKDLDGLVCLEKSGGSACFPCVGKWWHHVCLMLLRLAKSPKMLYCSGQLYLPRKGEASNKIQQTLLCLRACSNMLSSFISIYLYVS